MTPPDPPEDRAPATLNASNQYFRILGIEQKFQHFLNATVRSGSFYKENTHPLRFRDDHWVITQNGYGWDSTCV